MTERKKRKWTLMFFFASDNLLSPSMLTQIKSINAAGYQQDTNVLLHFDPNERGAPTRIFEINRSEKGRPSRIGDCDGPLVSVLTDDDITPKDMRRAEVDAVKAKDALESFLTLCREGYPADHYMLFWSDTEWLLGATCSCRMKIRFLQSAWLSSVRFWIDSRGT